MRAWATRRHNKIDAAQARELWLLSWAWAKVYRIRRIALKSLCPSIPCLTVEAMDKLGQTPGNSRPLRLAQSVQVHGMTGQIGVDSLVQPR